MRLTQHNGRKNENGVFNPKHNDRNFNIENSEHIKSEKSGLNEYWAIYEGMSFEDAEAKFYKDNFSKALELQNEKHIARRQNNRVRTIDDYRKNEKTCPEEQIIQLGKCGKSIAPGLLRTIIEEQVEWEKREFPNVVVLNLALHLDETTPHCHKRQVWVATDKNGNKVVSQNKALEQMGIKVNGGRNTRYNNAKMVYTERCREHLTELCRKHGIELEQEPVSPSKKHTDTMIYKYIEARASLKEMEKEVKRYASTDRATNAWEIKRLKKRLAKLEKYLIDNGRNPEQIIKAYSNGVNKGKTR